MAINCCPIENVQEIWMTKMEFGQPNAEIDWKMANGRLLSLALLVCMYIKIQDVLHTYVCILLD